MFLWYFELFLLLIWFPEVWNCFQDIFPDWFPYAIVRFVYVLWVSFFVVACVWDSNKRKGSGYLQVSIWSNRCLVYLSAAFLLACIVAGLFSSLSCSKSTSFFVIIIGNTSFWGNVFCSFQHKVDSVDYVGFACVRECFACENLWNFFIFYLLESVSCISYSFLLSYRMIQTLGLMFLLQIW